MTTETNTAPQSFRAALEARLTEQTAQGLHGEHRHTDHSWTNEVRSIPNEHVQHHPDPIIASAVDRSTGLSVDINSANVNPRNVIPASAHAERHDGPDVDASCD